LALVGCVLGEGSGGGLLVDLGELLEGMDVPDNRRDDLRWLLRNLAIRNEGNPSLPQALSVIRKLIQEGK